MAINSVSKSVQSTLKQRNRGATWPILLGLAGLSLAYAVVRSKSQQAEQRNPPNGKFLTVDGVRLHYLEQGQGPTLVLLHGNITMADDFRLSGLYARLAQDFRVIAFDRPGFGYSERPRSTIWSAEAQAALLLKALARISPGADGAAQHLDSHSSQPGYLVMGHSWGTLVALSMALQAPADVKGLLLLAGYYYPSMRLDIPMAALPAIPGLGDLLRWTLTPLLGRLMWPLTIKATFSPRPVAPSFRRLAPWMSLRPSQLRATAADAALMLPAAASLQHRYAELTLPVTILAGEGDKIVSTEHNAVRLHRSLAHSDLGLFPDAGHMLQHLQQDDIVERTYRLATAAGMLPSAGQAEIPQTPAAAVAASPHLTVT